MTKPKLDFSLGSRKLFVYKYPAVIGALDCMIVSCTKHKMDASQWVLRRESLQDEYNKKLAEIKLDTNKNLS